MYNPGTYHDATTKLRNSPGDQRPVVAESPAPLILLNVCETALGGVGRYQQILQALRSEGIVPHVLVPDSDRAILGAAQDVHTFPRRRRGPAALFAMTRAFFGLKRRLDPDVVFFHSTFSLLTLLAMRATGDRRPAVYCAHCWAVATQDPGSLKARLIRAVEGRLSGLADVVVNVSPNDLGIARANGYAGRHVLIEQAVPAAEIAARANRFDRADGEVHLLFVGRFDRQKGLDILLPAFARAHRTNPHLRLHLVGGPVRDGRVPDLPAGVINHGWAEPDALDDFYRSADATVIPSRWEGSPLVAFESLRNGTPLVISDRSAMAELTDNGACGLAFALDEAALVAVLAGLDRDRLRAMRPAASDRYARRHTTDRFARDMGALLRDLAGGRA